MSHLLRRLPVLCLLLSACDAVQPGPAPSATQAANGARSAVTFTATPNGRIDAYVRYDALRPGEALSALAGDAALVSRALPSGWHAVSARSESRQVLGIAGTRGGEVQWQTSGDLGEAGETSEGPTSIHFRRSCVGSYCVDVIEYDYDLTSPGGDGTVQWRAQGKERGEVDRIRVELPAQTGAVPTVQLHAPRGLGAVR